MSPSSPSFLLLTQRRQGITEPYNSFHARQCQRLLLAASPGESSGFCRVSVPPRCHCALAPALEPHQAHPGSLHPGSSDEESQQYREPQAASGPVPSPDMLRCSLFPGSHQSPQPHRSCHWGRWPSDVCLDPLVVGAPEPQTSGHKSTVT